LSEKHLRFILTYYFRLSHYARTHLSLTNDVPDGISRAGRATEGCDNREIAGLHSCAWVADLAPMFCLTESMINRLSKVHNLFVIARNSTFTYKDRPVRVQQVAEELGSTGRQRLELR
jgi:hypothetical protein